MQRQPLLCTFAALLIATAVPGLAQERAVPTQPLPQQPAAQPGPQQPPGQPTPQFQPFIPSGPNVAPGLPTVELAPILERVGRAANKRFLADGRVGPQIYLGGTEPNDITYPVLLSILRANNLAAVEIESRVNIVPVNDIRSYPLPMIQNDDASIPADEWVTRVLTTSNVEAAQLVPILRPLLPQWAHLAALPSSRLVVIDRYANVRRIAELVRLLDVPARN